MQIHWQHYNHISNRVEDEGQISESSEDKIPHEQNLIN